MNPMTETVHGSIKVMSYNIQHGVGADGMLDLDRIAAVIRNSGADLVGLQEVDRCFGDRSGYENQAERLSAMLEMEFAYGANLDWESDRPGGPRRQYGTAVLSRYPLLHTHNVRLGSREEQRGLLVTTVDIIGRPVHFCTTHLGLDPDERLAQVTEIKMRLSALTGPIILTGDLNAEPASDEIAGLLELFTDSFAGSTGSPTFPSDRPKVKIDYILSMGKVQAMNSAVLPSLASDHLPLTAVYRFTEND